MLQTVSKADSLPHRRRGKPTLRVEFYILQLHIEDIASGKEYYRRTVVTRLDVRSDSDEQLLSDTIDEWRDGCNLGSSLAWNKCHTKPDVQDIARDKLQDQTGLGS